MATRLSPPDESRPSDQPLPPLEPGDHLDQKTFHARYQAMRPHVRAELIEGIVYMPSPLRNAHGTRHITLAMWLGLYTAATPGVEATDNATVILSDQTELQPDAALRILPVHGGRCREVEGYLSGPPELVAEIALSSEAYDLHTKHRAYQRAGIPEYLAVILREPRVSWQVLGRGTYQAIEPGPGGVLRSAVFPGLWLNPAALLAGDNPGVIATLQQGLASPEHAAFCERMKKSCS